MQSSLSGLVARAEIAAHAAADALQALDKRDMWGRKPKPTGGQPGGGSPRPKDKKGFADYNPFSKVGSDGYQKDYTDKGSKKDRFKAWMGNGPKPTPVHYAFKPTPFGTKGDVLPNMVTVERTVDGKTTKHGIPHNTPTGQDILNGNFKGKDIRWSRR